MPLVLLLAGCRDLLAPGLPTRAEIVATAAPAPEDLRARPVEMAAGKARACDAVSGPASGLVSFTVVDRHGEPVANAPVGYRTYEDEEWTLAGRTDDIGTAVLDVPVGAQVTVIALRSKPGERCPYDALEPIQEEVGAAITDVTVAAHFQLGDVCPATVTVTDRGRPVAGAVVFRQAEPVGPYGGMEELAGTTGPDGVWRGVAPCGRGWWAADPPDGPRAVGGPAEGEVSLELPTEWVEVRGVVRSAAGVPIEGAEVRIDPWRGFDSDRPRTLADSAEQGTLTDAQGRYVLRIPAVEGDSIRRYHLGAWYGDHRAMNLSLARPGSPIAWDPTLDTAGRRVEVRCAGLPDDSCEDAPSIECNAAGRPERFVDRNGNERIGGVRQYHVTCPEGEAVVYAGPVAVRIGPDEDVAWLDYRGVDGAITGRVLGAPAGDRCYVYARAPFLAAFTGHLDADGFTRVADDGTFRLDRVTPGPYVLTARCGGDDVGERTVQVADAPVDVTIEAGP